MKIELNQKKADTIIHALLEESDRVKKAKGTNYGSLTLQEVDDLVADIRKKKEEEE